jgi:hypothetical protein
VPLRKGVCFIAKNTRYLQRRVTLGCLRVELLQRKRRISLEDSYLEFAVWQITKKRIDKERWRANNPVMP